MLKTEDFTSQSGINISVNDDEIIDVSIDFIYIDGEPVIDLFYLSESFEEFKMDFGGGVYSITCRDVLTGCDNDARKLRDMLNLRRTKQNLEVCEEILQICKQKVASGGYLY